MVIFPQVRFLHFLQSVNILPPPIDPVLRRVPPPFDFSKATKLKDFEIKLFTSRVQWITETLLNTKNLRKIGIHLQLDISEPIAATVRQEWRDLDRLLVQLWTSRPTRTEISFTGGRINMGRVMLPDLATKGAFGEGVA